MEIKEVVDRKVTCRLCRRKVFDIVEYRDELKKRQILGHNILVNRMKRAQWDAFKDVLRKYEGIVWTYGDEDEKNDDQKFLCNDHIATAMIGLTKGLSHREVFNQI